LVSCSWPIRIGCYLEGGSPGLATPIQELFVLRRWPVPLRVNPEKNVVPRARRANVPVLVLAPPNAGAGELPKLFLDIEMSETGPPRLRATLLILAGGESRRMGRPKALLPVGDSTLIEWLAARLAPTFDHLLVAGRDEKHLPRGLWPHLVPDIHPGGGPLAGVEAGLAASPHDTVLAIACDMPEVTPALARRLVAAAAAGGVDGAVPRVRGEPEPACAAYRHSAAGPIGNALSAGRFKAADVLGELKLAWLDDENPVLFANVNTPEDYCAFLERQRRAQY